MRRVRVVFFLGFCLALAALPGAAQRVTSDVLGTVTDTSGAVIAAATVTATNIETGLVRTTTTDKSGNYRIPGLAPGSYEVRVEQAGFKTAVRKGITLLVNQQAVVDVVMDVGDVQETVIVSGATPMIETTTSHMSNVVTEEVLTELPLNGRDLFQLVMLQTGVIPTTNAGPSVWAEGGITKAAVQGARPTMNNVTMDGGDVNDPGFNNPPGGTSGAQLGVEAVKEFRVLLNNFSAEYGRNGGANIQYVIKSGTNDVHGSVFEFHRNAALDARNFFDLENTPRFTRNQFGFALGGPIRRDQSFFFGNYEGFRESKSITSATSVPDDNVHLGLLPSAADPSVLVNIGVDPAIAPFLDLFPRSNGANLGGGIAVLQTSRVQSLREDYVVIRIDHQFSDRDQFFARYVFDDSDTQLPFQSTLVPGFDGIRDMRNQYMMLSWQRMLRSNLLNEFKFSFNRTRYVAEPDNQHPLSISLVPNRPVGASLITGLPLLGNNLIYPLGTTSNVFELIDNLSYQRGRHSLKFGANIKRMQVNGAFDLFVNGEYVFTDLTAFGFSAVSNNPPLEFFLTAAPFIYLGTDPLFSDSTRGYRQTYLGFYVQDDIRVTPRFTLNLGLRWEYSSNPSEQNGRNANIRDFVNDAAPTVGDIWDDVPLDLWSPRLGFAWTPFDHDKTVVRGGFGLFRDQIWANIYFDVRFYEPFYRALLIIFPSFVESPPSIGSLVGPFGIPPAVIGSFGITHDPDFPYYLQYNLNIQQELARDLRLQVAYVGSRGIHLLRGGEVNLLPGGGVINPNFGSIPPIVTDANSFYNSFQLSLVKRFSQGLSFQGSYTFSKSIDDQTGPFPSDWMSESGISQDFFNRKGDRGRSSFDRRHVFVFNFLYDLPWGPGRALGGDLTGAAAKIAEGWRIGAIATLMSNAPFTGNLGSFNNSGTFAAFPADRPNLRPGTDPCGATIGRPDQWFDPSIFTLPPPNEYGNAGRNILCGPNLRNFDFSIVKVTKIGERFGLEFRAEFFNIFNRTNFGVPANTQGPNSQEGNGDAIFLGRQGAPCDPATDPAGCGVLAPNVGRIFKTVTTSRQIQFGLKFIF